MIINSTKTRSIVFLVIEILSIYLLSKLPISVGFGPHLYLLIILTLIYLIPIQVLIFWLVTTESDWIKFIRQQTIYKFVFTIFTNDFSSKSKIDYVIEFLFLFQLIFGLGVILGFSEFQYLSMKNRNVVVDSIILAGSSLAFDFIWSARKARNQSGGSK